MRAHILNQGGSLSVPMGCDELAAERPLLARWCPVERKFVLAELDWNDQLDAVVALQLVRFRAGFDCFDA